MFTTSLGELVSSLEGLPKSLFAKESLKFPVGLDLGTVSRLSFTPSVSPCWNSRSISAYIWELQAP